MLITFGRGGRSCERNRRSTSVAHIILTQDSRRTISLPRLSLTTIRPFSIAQMKGVVGERGAILCWYLLFSCASLPQALTLVVDWCSLISVTPRRDVRPTHPAPQQRKRANEHVAIESLCAALPCPGTLAPRHPRSWQGGQTAPALPRRG